MPLTVIRTNTVLKRNSLSSIYKNGGDGTMKKHNHLLLLLLISALFFVLPCLVQGGEGEESAPLTQSDSKAKDKPATQFQLSEIEVKGQKEQPFVEHKKDETATQDIIPRKTIDLMAGPAQTSPFKALDMLPSVHSENSEAYGLINDQNNIRIRGQYGDTFSRFSRAIEGLPVSANVGAGFFGSPIDLENLSRISLIRGGVPSDKGFGYGNVGGALDQSILWSSDKFGATFRQSYGTEDFSRTFFRLDSGQLPTKTSFFASSSYTTAEKWRGPGNGDRKNVNLGITQQFPADLKISFLGAYNNSRQHAYRSLTYDQVRDSALRDLDYNPFLTGNALTDTLYYDYNRQEFEEYLGMLLVDYKPTATSYLTFKPYYYKADGRRLAGSGTTVANSYISDNHILQEQYGFLTEYGINIGPTLAKLGYYYMSMDTMPPASDQKNYTITAAGLKFKNWAYVNKVGSRTFNEPYLMLNNRFGNLQVDAGVRYVQAGLPSIKAYKTTGVPDVSLDDVYNYTTPIPGISVGSVALREWLPYLGLNYEINKQTNARLTYGRNYASPWTGPVYSPYYNNAAKFQAAGITLRDLWKDLKLETSDNIDLGVRYDQGSWYVAPTLFYGRFKHKQVPGVYDPVVGVSYYQNNAKAESKGIELEAGATPVSGLTIFGAVSYNDFRFTENIRTASNAIIDCKGKHIADSPEYMAKVGVSYTINEFTATPTFRYIGKRYGDSENKQRISAYRLVDLDLNYVLKKLWGFQEVSFGLNFSNLLNEKYISTIKNYQDTSTAMDTVYYPGSPFTVVGSIGFKF
jgi:iron complex outermembrane recepter protein